MGSKIIPSDHAHKDPHPPFYESDYWDYHFSLLPIFKPLPFLTVPYTYPRRDPIPGPKVLHCLLGLYQTLESTHFWKDREKLRGLRKENGDSKGKNAKRRGVYKKNKQ